MSVEAKPYAALVFSPAAVAERSAGEGIVGTVDKPHPVQQEEAFGLLSSVYCVPVIQWVKPAPGSLPGCGDLALGVLQERPDAPLHATNRRILFTTKGAVMPNAPATTPPMDGPSRLPKMVMLEAIAIIPPCRSGGAQTLVSA